MLYNYDLMAKVINTLVVQNLHYSQVLECQQHPLKLKLNDSPSASFSLPFLLYVYFLPLQFSTAAVIYGIILALLT